MLYLTHLLGLFVTAVASLAVAWWIHRRTSDWAGTVMISLLAIHAIMAVLVAVQLLVESLVWERLLVRSWLALILIAPMFWLVFAIVYTGHEYWLTRPLLAILVSYAVVPVGVFLTEPAHGLVGIEYVVYQEPFVHLSWASTTGLSVLSLVAMVPVLLGFAIVLRMHLRSRRTSRFQTTAILLGMLAVFVPAGLATTSYVPVVGFPYGVLGSGLFGIIVGGALFHNQMFGVAPLARDRLFRSLDDGVLVVDAQYRIVDYNEAMRSLLPDVDDRVAERLEDSYPCLLGIGETSEFPSTAAYESNQTVGPFAGTVSLPPLEPTRTLRLSVSVISSGGEPRGYALVFRDITELEAHAVDLEQKTQQLERFASVLSHDLRNPLSVAIGGVEMERSSRESVHLDRAIDALDRIDDMIDNLLALAREGEVVETPEPIALESVVTDAWETTDTRKATLSTDLDGMPAVMADRSRLQTMFENLFRNAVEHGSTNSDPEDPGGSGERGGEDLTVTVGRLSDGFYVEDDGPGVPPEKRDDIFEYGYSEGDGTGLGLAIVRAIVDAHGWSISVTDGRDGGARFEVVGVERRIDSVG